LYRLRVGRFRVVYEVRDEVLLVLIVRVAKRDEATYRNL
jgi:mRNA-degrading endonuclease RelE of RelBE toxin-antitoxin system